MDTPPRIRYWWKMKHNLKLKECFEEAVANGDKRFELRRNDRCFQRGDTVTFTVIDNEEKPVSSTLDVCEFEITYVLSGFGMREEFVAFGIKEKLS